MSEIKITHDSIENGVFRDGQLAIMGFTENYISNTSVTTSGVGNIAVGGLSLDNDYIYINGTGSFAHGRNVSVNGNYSHAEGENLEINASCAHAEGENSSIEGRAGHVEGLHTYVGNIAGHAEGYNTKAFGMYSHAEGYNTSTNNTCAHAEGYFTTASGLDSHTEGCNTTASQFAAHAEGCDSSALGEYSHAEGIETTASGHSSHAEGEGTTASGDYGSHAEGGNTNANGNYSHAEGYSTTASGKYSHAEGYGSIADSSCAHAEGLHTIASGDYSHAGGIGTIANQKAMTAIGKYNVSTNTEYTLFVVGDGTSTTEIERSDAFRVNKNGSSTASPSSVQAKVNGVSDVYLGCPIGTVLLWPKGMPNNLPNVNIPNGWIAMNGQNITTHASTCPNEPVANPMLDGVTFAIHAQTTQPLWWPITITDAEYEEVFKIMGPAFYNDTILQNFRDGILKAPNVSAPDSHLLYIIKYK